MSSVNHRSRFAFRSRSVHVSFSHPRTAKTPYSRLTVAEEGAKPQPSWIRTCTSICKLQHKETKFPAQKRLPVWCNFAQENASVVYLFERTMPMHWKTSSPISEQILNIGETKEPRNYVRKFYTFQFLGELWIHWNQIKSTFVVNRFQTRCCQEKSKQLSSQEASVSITSAVVVPVCLLFTPSQVNPTLKLSAPPLRNLELHTALHCCPVAPPLHCSASGTDHCKSWGGVNSMPSVFLLLHCLWKTGAN